MFLPKHESQNGVALTKEEEKEFLHKLKGSKFELCFAIALYTGNKTERMYKRGNRREKAVYNSEKF